MSDVASFTVKYHGRVTAGSMSDEKGTLFMVEGCSVAVRKTAVVIDVTGTLC